jgi:hypothetical protein
LVPRGADVCRRARPGRDSLQELPAPPIRQFERKHDNQRTSAPPL